jgi:hypothetical protein
MTYQDEDRIRNPNDPWQREWGTGSMISILIAAAIMAGIIVHANRSDQYRLAPDHYWVRWHIDT